MRLLFHYCKHLLFAFVVVCLWSGWPCVAYAATITVNTNIDVEPRALPDQLCSLREAIGNANRNSVFYPDCPIAGEVAPVVDTIVINLPPNSSILLDKGHIKIVDSLTVQAPNQARLIGSNWQGRIFELDGIAFWQGQPIAVNLDSLTFAGGRARQGGAIYAHHNVALTITNSQFISNTAYTTPNEPEARGGAIYGVHRVALRISGVTFTENVAREGGAMALGDETTLTIENNSSFTNNRAVYGGALDISGNTASIVNSRFTGNQADDYGAAISIFFAATSIFNSTFTDNRAGDFGGALDAPGSVVASTNNTYSNNVASADGGAIASTDRTQLDSQHDTFTNNTAAVDGGAIANFGGTINLVDTQLLNNRANDDGGAVYNTPTDIESTLNLLGTGSISGNQAGNHGGAIYHGSGLVTTTVNIAGPTLTANSAGGAGGAIYSTATGDSGITGIRRHQIRLEAGTVIRGNTATQEGGAIYLEEGSLHSNTVLFDGNRTLGSGANGGGAIYSQRSFMQIIDSTFVNNVAQSRDGGAIDSGSSSLTVTKTNFSNNQAATDNGGAINCSTPGLNVSIKNITILTSTLASNVAGKDGGALRLNSCTAQLQSSSLFNNVAGSNGGAVANSGSLDIVNTTMGGNQARQGNGGGIYNIGSSPQTTIVRLFNSTLVQNQANGANGRGGGIHNTDQTTARIQIANTILAGNTANINSTEADCSSTGSTPAGQSLGYNLVGAGTHASCAFDGAGDREIDPNSLFIQVLEPAAADNGGETFTYAISGNRPGITVTELTNNPAIDTGNPAGCRTADVAVVTDQRGIERRGLCDIGAYEAIFFKVTGATAIGTEEQADRTVTATLFAGRWENQARVPGVAVTYTVTANATGAIIASDSKTTDNSGEIKFTYPSRAPIQAAATQAPAATDTIASWADLDKDGRRDPGEPSDLRDLASAITLVSFTAQLNDNATVTLSWQTAVEIDNAGFNLYRAPAPEGPYSKLNPQLIAGQGTGYGASYNFVDTPLVPGPFYYKLEDVDYNGQSTLHGPITAGSGGILEAGQNPVYLPLVVR